jgi:lipopolysaccharide/colanic/teichoic acid biosynthesis glycosyltransferase
MAAAPSAPSQAATSSPATLQDLSAAADSRRKRALDIGLIVVALPLLLPLCLIIVVLVASTSRGGVLFFQQRIGLNGKQFRLVKFRTMRTDAESHLRSDPALWETYVRNDFKLPAEMETRVTGIGRILRRSSLDELPQLLNVLRGQMSLVGPRPIVPEELDKYGDESHCYLSVRPGITGIWQVNGRSGVGYPERITLDREYTESWSFWQDVRILLRTPIAVVSRRGAH